MSGSSFRYLIKEGFRNTWTNRMMSIASICVLLSCLVIIGSASMIFLNIESLVNKIEAENVIMVYIGDKTLAESNESDSLDIDSSITQEDIDKMGDELKAMSNVENVEFVSKEEAWDEQLATMEDAQAELFKEETDKIPLPNAYKVTVKDLSQFNQTVDEIKELDNIYTVRQNTEHNKRIFIKFERNETYRREYIAQSADCQFVNSPNGTERDNARNDTENNTLDNERKLNETVCCAYAFHNADFKSA